MNTTAPLLRTPHRPARQRPTHHLTRSARQQFSAVIRSLRYDDRPEVERFTTPSELALRPYRSLDGPRF